MESSLNTIEVKSPANVSKFIDKVKFNFKTTIARRNLTKLIMNYDTDKAYPHNYTGQKVYYA